MSVERTKMWTIDEHPGYTIELTPRLWVLWGPCPEENLEDVCERCDGSHEIIINTCSIHLESGRPENCHMIQDALGITNWIPRRIQ